MNAPRDDRDEGTDRDEHVERDGSIDRDSCAHCGLPTPTPPVTDEGIDGSYCCRGCLAVARALGSADFDTHSASE
ncbi:heavy metal translocating P-type ATPase metal-binding domain-containing protein [Halobellus captivus]|uniref:heavy metal translocating P-type ATPase metal-binding domain-containing protein n=1 Tax=Halobellus captivus TaxID=2592614 RepID=UPI0011A27510